MFTCLRRYLFKVCVCVCVCACVCVCLCVSGYLFKALLVKLLPLVVRLGVMSWFSCFTYLVGCCRLLRSKLDELLPLVVVVGCTGLSGYVSKLLQLVVHV